MYKKIKTQEHSMLKENRRTGVLVNKLLGFMLLFAIVASSSLTFAANIPYTKTFEVNKNNLRPFGLNDYFIPLFPGNRLLLEGEEDGAVIRVLITVLARTRIVDGVRCSVVREVEWEDGEIFEISWNYFAIDRRTKSVFYFGEHVNDYEDGELVGHEGEWLAGVDGAQPGLIMPGLPLNGSRYFQEYYPGVAVDRAEHLNNNVMITVPAGTFDGCLYVAERSSLEPGEISYKTYAPGIGIVHDDIIELISSKRIIGHN